MKKFLLLLISFYCFVVNAQTSADKKQILDILDRQTRAWNDGKVVDFMNGYWESDSLMYIGKSGVTYGFNSTLERYKKNYPDKSTMGILEFDIIKVDFISRDACFIVGKWHLTRLEKGDVGGHYTLLWRRMKGKWVIVSDHSS
jgi:hypothetical protein